MSNLEWEPPDALTPLSCDKILWKETSARCSALGVTCGEIFLHVQNCAGVFFFVLYVPLSCATPRRRKNYNMMEIYFLNVVALSWFPVFSRSGIMDRQRWTATAQS